MRQYPPNKDPYAGSITATVLGFQTSGKDGVYKYWGFLSELNPNRSQFFISFKLKREKQLQNYKIKPGLSVTFIQNSPRLG